MTSTKTISVGTAALITGLTLFLPAAPYAEFYVFRKLIVYNDAAQTTQNLLNHPQLFLTGVFAMLFTHIEDVLIAWTLYIFLKPVHASVALLAAWLRLISTALSIVALCNFLHAFQLLYLPAFQGPDRSDQVLQLVNARRFSMHFAYIIFGIYLVLIGVLICRSTYVPGLLGILMLLAGLAWIIINLQPYFFKGYNVSWLMFLSIGELFFIIWLLVKGRRIRENEIRK